MNRSDGISPFEKHHDAIIASHNMAETLQDVVIYLYDGGATSIPPSVWMLDDTHFEIFIEIQRWYRQRYTGGNAYLSLVAEIKASRAKGLERKKHEAVHGC